ncbi:MAG TPA: hypothetical protein VG891_03645 [Rhizomicrobium sp.]|nr:hypothetical protein [Rhizomicrobium sp.]
MLDPRILATLKESVQQCIELDKPLLDQLVNEIQPLRSSQRRIQPRAATSVSLVGADGGNNELRFDPFQVQIIRIVDSNENEYWTEVISPTSPLEQLNNRHIGENGEARSPLGRMMLALGVRSLSAITPMIKDVQPGEPRPPSWTQVYRELTEWAVLLDLLKKDYGSDTLIVFDGLLRSKVFSRTLFRDLGTLFKAEIDRLARSRRNVFLVGVAKHSKVIERYRLAMKILGVLRDPFPAFVEVPRELEAKAYVWPEYARGQDDESEGGEQAKYLNGKMFLVKFGNRPGDTIWPVDVFEPQTQHASTIFGYLVKDAEEGFPVALYPRCLQKAHEAAALSGLGMDMLQDIIFAVMRLSLGDRGTVLDEFQFESNDPAAARYR